MSSCAFISFKGYIILTDKLVTGDFWSLQNRNCLIGNSTEKTWNNDLLNIKPIHNNQEALLDLSQYNSENSLNSKAINSSKNPMKAM